ncbi:glycosyltransferase family 4 protein [Kribbia dieselivorans]|uniref:glycosyltransferase family 4 protein n=1 Tax=Kribbia dieselivorans TaxID=331526 RepID=UPI0008399C84|nr:glycosyltransferase family 1 protein [Kribbia dieselivorans]
MNRLTIASAATAAPMGAQVYQEEIAARAASSLANHGEWHVDRVIARSLRSPLPGTHRLPSGWMTNAGVRQRDLVGRALYRRSDVVHRMNLELPPGPTEVVTLHDVVAWRFDDESDPVPAAAAELRRAAAVICVSEFSAQEAIDLLGIRDPYVVPNGVSPDFLDAAPLPESVLTELGVDGRYVLIAGGAATRKNLEGLADAWPIVRAAVPDLSLVLSGPEHQRRTSLFAHQPGTHLVGRIPGEMVPGLVAAAAVVVVPSLYEGFGLPALEAMAAGTPVVAANTSSLPEVVGDAARLVEPTGAAIAEGIIDAVRNPDDAMTARARERARIFTWERSAAAHAEVWAKVAAGR